MGDEGDALHSLEDVSGFLRRYDPQAVFGPSGPWALRMLDLYPFDTEPSWVVFSDRRIPSVEGVRRVGGSRSSSRARAELDPMEIAVLESLDPQTWSMVNEPHDYALAHLALLCIHHDVRMDRIREVAAADGGSELPLIGALEQAIKASSRV